MEVWRKNEFKIFTFYTDKPTEKKTLLDRLHVVLHQGKRIIWKLCANRVPTLTHPRERIIILSKRLVKN